MLFPVAQLGAFRRLLRPASLALLGCPLASGQIVLRPSNPAYTPLSAFWLTWDVTELCYSKHESRVSVGAMRQISGTLRARVIMRRFTDEELAKVVEFHRPDNDSLSNALERRRILRELNLRWDEYASLPPDLVIDYSYARRLIKYAEDPKLSPEWTEARNLPPWNKPRSWSDICTMLEQSDKMFIAMLKDQTINDHNVSRVQIRQFVKVHRLRITNRNRPAIRRWESETFRKMEFGDSREVLKSYPDQSVQCIVTSPPYFAHRDYNFAGQIGQEKMPEEYVEEANKVFHECHRILRNDGVMFLVMGDTFGGASGLGTHDGATIHRGTHTRKGIRSEVWPVKPKSLIGIPWRLAFRMQQDGWLLRQCIIWDKDDPMTESVKDRPSTAHEYIFLFSKAQKYYYNWDAIAEPANDYPTANRDHDKKNRGMSGQRPHGGLRDQHYTRKNKRSVWKMPTARCLDEHYATFPFRLVELCVFAGSSEYGCCAACGKALDEHGRPWDSKPCKACRFCDAPKSSCVIMDPFAGIETVGAIAITHFRSFWGVELNPKYHAMAEKQMQLYLDYLDKRDTGAGW